MMCGMSRSAVSDALTRLAAGGVVERMYSGVVLRHIEGLGKGVR